MEVTADKALLRLDIYILTVEHLEKWVFYFIKITRDDKKTNEEAETVFDLEEKIKIKRALYKEKKNAQALLLATTCLSTPPSMSVLGFLALFAFIVSMPRLFGPLFALLVLELGCTCTWVVYLFVYFTFAYVQNVCSSICFVCACVWVVCFFVCVYYA